MTITVLFLHVHTSADEWWTTLSWKCPTCGASLQERRDGLVEKPDLGPLRIRAEWHASECRGRAEVVR